MIFQQAAVLAISAFIAQAIVRPALARYSTWKHDPHREQVARRDWRGRYVPDLMVKRIERTAWIALTVLFALGLFAGWVVMTAPPPPVHIPI